MVNLKDKIQYSIKQALKYAYSVVPLPIRYGRVFRDTYKFLQESQWWDRRKLEEYQIRQLELLIKHAYNNVPYYRRIFDERGLKPKNIKCFDDLRKLPYLTKHDVRNNLSDLIAKNYPKTKIHYVRTSGSVGIPLSLCWENGVTDPKESAFIWRQWNWAGYFFGQKRLILRGNIINKVKDGKRHWCEYNPLQNALVLSSYDMKNENLSGYIEEIIKFRPEAIQGYPSSLYILADFLREKKQKLHGIRCIFTSSETLLYYQKEKIIMHLGARIYDHYGNTERNALIMQCEEGNYHIISEYGVLQLEDADGRLIQEENTVGEIIATGFDNYAMPFIRYRTGDRALSSNKICTCGRNFPLLGRIEGRTQEFIVTNYNGYISMTVIHGLHSDIFDNVKQFQFYQDMPSRVILKIVKRDAYSEMDSSKIINKLQEELGHEMDIQLVFVNEIPRSAGGKLGCLEQKLHIRYGE